MTDRSSLTPIGAKVRDNWGNVYECFVFGDGHSPLADSSGSQPGLTRENELTLLQSKSPCLMLVQEGNERGPFWRLATLIVGLEDSLRINDGQDHYIEGGMYFAVMRAISTLGFVRITADDIERWPLEQMPVDIDWNTAVEASTRRRT